ncbi:unnamed protein product [Penicillium salamii]|nr:unnamed protein product [Penicillium salamii]
MILSNNPNSNLFLGTQSLQNILLPLHQAVTYSSLMAVQQLLKRKNPVLDSQDRKGYIPLDLVIKSNHSEVADLLLSHLYAKVNCIDKDGNIFLWLSTYLSYYKIIKRLLAEKDIDMNLIGGHRRFEMPSISLHYTIIRLDTMFL